MGGLFETSDLEGELKDNYSKKEILDYNVYGVTHKCREIKTNKIVAIKIINKRYLEKVCGNKNLEDCLECVYHEIECLKEMDGEFSIHLIENTETSNCFYLVMDIWDSNLEKYLKDKNFGLKIEEIKTIFEKLNIVFKRMFKKNIIHGNLKLENIFLKIENEIITPLLGNYGKNAALDDRLSIVESTTHYTAPELLYGDDYDYKVDLWSIGVMLYRLYFNEFPFNGETQVSIFNDMQANKTLKKSDYIFFDDLISKLLVVDPKKRLSWVKYFNHKFWKSNKEENEDTLYEEVEGENESDNDENNNWKRESKYRSKRIKNLGKNHYNIFYCLNDSDNPAENNGIKNIQDLKKIEISMDDNNKDGNINDSIYKNITKYIQLDKLGKLILYGCNLKDIDLLTKINANNLLELDLSNNDINNIDIISSLMFRRLITLNLSYNKIHSIDPLIDAHFIDLKNLYLSNNIISNIESLYLVPFSDLDKLKLSGNKIRDISVFIKVPFINLTYLDLKNNKLRDISSALSSISIINLLYLNLSHNSIQSLEGLKVKQFHNLLELNLGNNQLSNIDLLTKVRFNKLNKLDLYDNNIQDKDIHIFGKVPFKGLRQLNLSYNIIKTVEIINIMNFDNLNKLDLNGNEIDDLRSLNLSKLSTLKELQLKNNNLKKFEENQNILNYIKKQYGNLNLIYN